MKKLQIKKAVAYICVAVLLISSCVEILGVSAATVSGTGIGVGSQYNNTTYNFDGITELSEIGAEVTKISKNNNANLANMTASITDGALSLKSTATAGVPAFRVLFPYTLKADTSYTLTYSYKLIAADGSYKGARNDGIYSGWATGYVDNDKPIHLPNKSTGTDMDTGFCSGTRVHLSSDTYTYVGNNYTNGNIISYLGADIGKDAGDWCNDYKLTPASNYATKTVTFSTDNLCITDGYNQLALQIGFDGLLAYEVIIDNVAIYENAVLAKPTGYGIYDFSESLGDTGIGTLKAGNWSYDSGEKSSITVTEDGSLSLKTVKVSDDNATLRVLFPYTLKAGAAYTMTYKYRVVSASTVSDGAAVTSTAGNNYIPPMWTTGKLVDSKPDNLYRAEQTAILSGTDGKYIDVASNTGVKAEDGYTFLNKIAYFGKQPDDKVGTEGKTDAYQNGNSFTVSEDWTTVTISFTADNLRIDEGYNQLALQFAVRLNHNAEFYIDDIEIQEEQTATYENDFSYGTAGISYNVINSTEISNENGALRITGTGDNYYGAVDIKLPVKLSNNKTYVISYDYRSVREKNNRTEFRMDSSVFAGAADAVNESKAADFVENMSLLAPITGIPGDTYAAVNLNNSTDWTTNTYTVTTSGISEDNYLSIRIAGYYDLYLDNFTIAIAEYGDINSDEVIDIRDLVRMKKCLAYEGDETAIDELLGGIDNMYRLDCDGDSKNGSSVDLTTLRKFLLGIEKILGPSSQSIAEVDTVDVINVCDIGALV